MYRMLANNIRTLCGVCTHIKHDDGCYESQWPISLCARYAHLVQMKSAGTLSYSSGSTWHLTFKLKLLGYVDDIAATQWCIHTRLGVAVSHY